MEINYLKLQRQLEVRQNIMYIYLANQVSSTTGQETRTDIKSSFWYHRKFKWRFLSFDAQNNGIKINKNISKIRVTTKVLFDASSYQIENPVVRSRGTKKYISVIISNSTKSKKYWLSTSRNGNYIKCNSRRFNICRF